ncbi:MAG: hypothetical protein IT290_11150 [Deltaproteobacteria bacterium]|nr:hypothetical protein [Deltaproteobacteria bacterium]
MQRRATPSISFSSIAVSSLAILSLATGCRFESPDFEEQRFLASQGAFALGPPSWTALDVGATRMNSGLIPETYGPPDQIRGSLASDALVASQEAQWKLDGEQREKERTEPVVEEAPQSALDRIVTMCPQIENDLTGALSTGEPTERVQKFETLTERCPESRDLWLWYASDSARLGRIAAAKRGYDRVLSISPGDADAMNGLERLATGINPTAPATDLAPGSNLGSPSQPQ